MERVRSVVSCAFRPELTKETVLFNDIIILIKDIILMKDTLFTYS